MKILCRKLASAKLPKIKCHMSMCVTKKGFKYFRRKLPKFYHIYIKFQKIEKFETLKTASKRFWTGDEKNIQGKA